MAFAHPDQSYEYVAFHARVPTTSGRGAYLGWCSVDATPFNNTITLSPEQGSFPGGIHVDRKSGRELAAILTAACDFLDAQLGDDA